MKKIVFFLAFAFLLVQFGCKESSNNNGEFIKPVTRNLKSGSNDTLNLTDLQCQEILNSFETRMVVHLKRKFLRIVHQSVVAGQSIDSLRKLTLNGLSKPNDEKKLKETLFGSEGAANAFYYKLKNAGVRLHEKFPILNDLQPCGNLDTEQSAIYFFDNFNEIYNAGAGLSALNAEEPNPEPDSTITYPPGIDVSIYPVCGSLKNQLLLLACVTACSGSTAGIGTPLCGWWCWCTCCRQFSELANIICPDWFPTLNPIE